MAWNIDSKQQLNQFQAKLCNPIHFIEPFPIAHIKENHPEVDANAIFDSH